MPERRPAAAKLSAMDFATARWFDVRRAQNLKPATYRCPLCGERLPALSEHMLIVPEGRSDGRRHAHVACVLAARRAGRLPTRAEWRRAQPVQPSGSPMWRRAWERLTGHPPIGRGGRDQ